MTSRKLRLGYRVLRSKYQQAWALKSLTRVSGKLHSAGG